MPSPNLPSRLNSPSFNVNFFFFLSSTSCETLHLTSPKRSAEKHSSNMNGRGVCGGTRECVHLLRQTRIYGILLHGSNVNREAHEYSCLQKSNDGNATMGCESEGIELDSPFSRHCLRLARPPPPPTEKFNIELANIFRAKGYVCNICTGF